MTRWTTAPAFASGAALPRHRFLFLAALLLSSAAGVARADELRSFPAAALRGELEVVTPPTVELDGKVDQLSMGARIRDTRNLFVTSGTLADGQVHLVNYLRNPQGQISEVWILTAEEAAIGRASATPTIFQRLFGF